NPLLAKAVAILCEKPARVVLADGEDNRSVAAALRLRRDGLAWPVLMGRPLAIRALIREELRRCGCPPAPVEIIDPAAPALLAKNTTQYMEQMRESGKQADQGEAECFMRQGPPAAAMMVRRGEVEVGVGGNMSSTADMLRAGLRVLGTAPGSKTVSGFFFMIAPDDLAGAAGNDEGRVIIFADGGVIPEPTQDQLIDIAIDSARQYQRMTGNEPRVAMLSFSSHGSAKHPRAEFVRATVERIRQKAPGLVVDGELQFDAAAIPRVADQKVPGSPLGGRANVFIFPSLEAGNISYKIAERLGHYMAVGPLLQGLNGGWHDLSRGCSADDIYQVAVIGAVLQRG
ncbi:MAG: phosphotransacetylase, partial [Comamonas sp.]|nr:phosphotransacetylase [Comamonas sp.]